MSLAEKKLFLLDMDGTIYLSDRLFEGAAEFLSLVKARGGRCVFLTNNSAYPRRHYLDKLLSMGFDVGMENVLTSTVATIRFLLSERPGKKVYPIASPGVVADLEEAGLILDFENPDIVLLAFDRTITYDKINAGYRFLKCGAELIATHPDDLCPTEDSYDVDIGPFIRLFEQMCCVKATVIGKPSGLMLSMAAREMGVDPEGTVMVGDRLYTDM